MFLIELKHSLWNQKQKTFTKTPGIYHKVLHTIHNSESTGFSEKEKI